MALFSGSGSVGATEIHGCTFTAGVTAEVWDNDGAITDVQASGQVILSGNRMSATRVRAGSLAVWGNDIRLVDVWVTGNAELSGPQVRATNLHVGGTVDASGSELQWTGGTVGTRNADGFFEAFGGGEKVVNVDVFGDVHLGGGNGQWSGGRIRGTLTADGSAEIIDGTLIDGDVVAGYDATIRGCVVGQVFGPKGSILLNAWGESATCTVTDNLVYPPDDTPGIVVDGNGNVIVGNRIVGASSPHAIEIESGDGNVMVGNIASGSFTAAEYVDAGTNTQTVWPSASAPQGDNLII